MIPSNSGRQTLRNEILLKLLQELKVEKILWSQSLLTDHSLHSLHILTDGIASILEGVGKE
jgi:hypothetical protein